MWQHGHVRSTLNAWDYLVANFSGNNWTHVMCYLSESYTQQYRHLSIRCNKTPGLGVCINMLSNTTKLNVWKINNPKLEMQQICNKSAKTRLTSSLTAMGSNALLILQPKTGVAGWAEWAILSSLLNMYDSVPPAQWRLWTISHLFRRELRGIRNRANERM